MSAIIVIEIVIGLVVLAAAVRFAVRDARERGGFAVDYSEAEPSAVTAVAPERAAKPQAQEHLSEVGGAEKS
ncbi:MAG TPA: hypothetical protein VFO16_11770 [Pseudonocardiaceae bacterium]|nr:hypothetical protein [Pseudonocardiaceae bacterium]